MSTSILYAYMYMYICCAQNQKFLDLTMWEETLGFTMLVNTFPFQRQMATTL